MLETEEPMVSFTALDRCDGCPAQAVAQAEKSSAESDLLFCWHHSEKFKDVLVGTGWTVRWDAVRVEQLTGTPMGAY